MNSICKHTSKIITLCLIFFSNFSYSEILATCEKPSGHAYFAYAGMNDKKISGWDKDKISNGLTQLEYNNGKFDIQFVDATKQIISARDTDGADVFPFAYTDEMIGVNVVYMGRAIETYSFIKEKSGKLVYTYTATKVNAMVPKATVMVGTCSLINVEAFTKIIESN